VPRIFISHRNGEESVIALIKAIDERLAAAGFDVLVDFDRLRPGASWRDEIYTWLGVCHAGVILLSPDALSEGSVWVPRESSILAWRKALEPGFTLIPVLLPGVTTDDLRGDPRFRDLGLHDLQIITHVDAAATCAELQDGLARLAAAPRTPLEELAEQIQALLDGVKPDFIQEGLRRCAVDASMLSPLGDTARKLALALLQVPLSNALSALEYLAERTSTPTAIDRILEIIAPSWVDICAARWIAACASPSERRPAAVINATTKFAAEMYVRRASCRPPKTMWRVIPVTAVCGELVFEDLATEIYAALLASFSTSLIDDPFAAAPEAQLLGVLKELSRRGRPVVIVLRLPPGVAELLPQLQERFPQLTFLFLSGKDLPDPAACPETLLRRVEPALPDGREITACVEYQTARSILRPGV